MLRMCISSTQKHLFFTLMCKQQSNAFDPILRQPMNPNSAHYWCDEVLCETTQCNSLRTHSYRKCNRLNIEYNVISQHTQSYFELVIVALIQVLNVHVQKTDLNVAVSIHSNGPSVIGIIGVRPGIQWGCYLTKLPRQIIAIY